MNAASRMDRQATFYTRTDAAKDALGAVREGFAPVATPVWVHVSAPNEGTRRRQERYASPVTALLTCYPHAACVAGNRVAVGGVTYEILGVDATARDLYHADIGEVV